MIQGQNVDLAATDAYVSLNDFHAVAFKKLCCKAFSKRTQSPAIA
jgi:hypothetical protein